MKDLLILLIHLRTTIAKLMEPVGARTIVADALPVKQNLMIINRSWKNNPPVIQKSSVIVQLLIATHPVPMTNSL
jgi:hypothetical protein